VTDSQRKEGIKNVPVSRRNELVFPLSRKVWLDFFGPVVGSVERFFDCSRDSIASGSVFDKIFCPVINVEANDKEYVVTVELPGVLKEDFEVTLDENVLSVEGDKERLREENDESGEVFRSERSYGYFKRSVCLGEDVDPNFIANATLSDGILKIDVKRLPREEKKGAKRIEVT